MRIQHILYILLGYFFLLSTNVLANNKISRTAIPTWIRQSTVLPTKVNLEDISQGFYYEKIEYQVNLKLETKFYRDVKVLFDTNGAENAGQIYINFDPKYQQLIMHELTVIREGKPLDKLDLNRFEVVATETDLSRFIYNGTYSAYLILDDLRKDDKIVISYSLKGINPVFEQKFFDRFNLQSYEPTGLVHINYVVPKDRQLHFKMHNAAKNPTVEQNNESTSYSWEVQAQPAIAYSTYAPMWYLPLQWGECTEYNSWNEVALWAKKINPISPLKEQSPLANLVNQYWTESKGDTSKFVQKITHFVQNDIRYMGVEMGEYSHRANLPEKVFTQRYGDCKDKSVLLASMLNHKGIKCSLVLANTYLEHSINDLLPSPAAFNHMTVSTDLNGFTQYIDPTITDQSGAINLRYFPNYGSVLVLNNPGKLQKLPQSISGSIQLTETYLLDNKGGAILEVKTQYRGSNSDFIRTYFKTNARNQIQKSYLEYYQRLYPKITTKENLKYLDHPESNKIIVTEKYTIEKIGDLDKEKNKRVLAIYANHINDKLPIVNASKESAPIALLYPLSINYTIQIVNPEGFPFDNDNVKQTTTFNRNAYTFIKSTNTSKDTLSINYQLNSKESFVSPADKEQYVNDFSNRDDILYNGYYLEDNGVVVFANGTSSTSIFAVLYAIIVICIMTYIIFIYYKKSASSIIPIEKRNSYTTFDGWLGFLLIAMIMSAIGSIYQVFASNVFSTTTWSSFEYYDPSLEFTYQFLLGFELFSNLFSICGFIFSIYLFLKKRDIFPQTFLFILVVKFICIIIITYSIYHLQLDHLIPDLLTDNLKSIVFCIGWGSYIYLSQRVRRTFIQPYSNQEARANTSIETTNE